MPYPGQAVETLGAVGESRLRCCQCLAGFQGERAGMGQSARTYTGYAGRVDLRVDLPRTRPRQRDSPGLLALDVLDCQPGGVVVAGHPVAAADAELPGGQGHGLPLELLGPLSREEREARALGREAEPG